MQADTIDWNVIVTVYDGEFSNAWRELAGFGTLARTNYWNVLVMGVGDTDLFMQRINEHLEQDASLANSISRIVPVTEKFHFQSAEEFEAKAKTAVEQWLPDLAGKTFHVRMHRRGFKGRISSQHEEQFLDHHLLEHLASAGQHAAIGFDDPDAIIVIETIDQTAGLSFWTREDLHAFELARLD